ncbi:MAG: NAD(P)-dependent oxidoreductase [bacterium]
MKMKVLIADKFPDFYVQKLKDKNVEVIYEPKLGENDIPKYSNDVDTIVVRSTKVNADAIVNSTRLNLIIRAGAGFNNIDIKAANKKGIYVANCPGKNSIAVAELAMGLIIALDRKIADNVADFNNGVWNKEIFSKAEGLAGKTLAIIGYGNIGKELAKRALAFGIRVLVKDVMPITDEDVEVFDDFAKTLPRADIISLHLPANAQTRGLFNEKMFGYLKPGTILINTSRAEVIDEDALIKAIKENNLKVGLDVFKGEPEGKNGFVSSLLQGLPNVYVTHHIGASTEQAQNAVAEETVKIIHHYVETGTVLHWVNNAKAADSPYQLIVKHYDKPGVLASVLDVLKQGDINIEEMENIIFDDRLVASCTLKLKTQATEAMLKIIAHNVNVISVSHTKA